MQQDQRKIKHVVVEIICSKLEQNQKKHIFPEHISTAKIQVYLLINKIY